MTTAVRWSGLSGALRLARGRADGLLLFPADLISAARSFWAAALCVPLYALMLVLSWHQVGWPADLPHEAVLQAVLFVLGWAGYAVISFEMLSALGIAGRWPRFIIVWNWVNVVQVTGCCWSRRRRGRRGRRTGWARRARWWLRVGRCGWSGTRSGWRWDVRA